MIHNNLSHGTACNGFSQPVRIGRKADLNEHTLQLLVMDFSCFTIHIGNAVNLVCAGNFFCLNVLYHCHIGQTVKTLLENGIRLQLRHKFKNCHMAGDPSKINCRFNAGIAASDDCHLLSFIKGAVTMRTISNSLILKFRLSRYTHISPPGACR